MSAYAYVTTSQIISDRPCKLLSVIVITDGGGPGKVDIYDAGAINASYKVATLRCSGNAGQQYSWKGLELQRGLYVEMVEKADFVTIEWEPLELKEQG